MAAYCHSPVRSTARLVVGARKYSHLEVCGADGLPDDVPIVSAAPDGQLVLYHDVQQLLAHLLGLAQALGMEEMAVAPVRPEKGSGHQG